MIARAIVTGSGGFVGARLMRLLPGAIPVHLADPEWRRAIEAADYRGAVVFHLAARVHETSGRDEAWRIDNVEKTEALARAAAAAGAARFVFMSTLKVHGDETHGRAIRADDAFAPGDGYARSKAQAEEALRSLSRRSELPVAVVRAPLVFGPGARANLEAAARLAATAMPLPFASIRNRRSWVHVDDLCRLLLECGRHEAAAGRAFIAAQAEPFSTPRLFAGLRARMNRGARLFPMPPSLLEGAAALTGHRAAMRRLTRSFEADASDTARLLGWHARISFDDALQELAAAAGARK